MEFWLAFERGGSWGPKVPKQLEPPLTELEEARVTTWLASRERSRLQLVRPSPGSEGVTIGVSKAGPGGWVATQRLDSLSDAAATDLGDPATWGTCDNQPRYLVCTHGKRDGCCARLGLPAFQALQAVAGERVLQTSHLGGHRFAPTILVLPHGYMYGRVPIERCAEIVAAHDSDELGPLEFVRGRVDLAGPDQFAELFLRRELGLRRLDALVFDRNMPSEGGSWRSTWRAGDRVIDVDVHQDTHPLAVLRSCGDEAAERVTAWRVMAWSGSGE